MKDRCGTHSQDRHSLSSTQEELWDMFYVKINAIVFILYDMSMTIVAIMK